MLKFLIVLLLSLPVLAQTNPVTYTPVDPTGKACGPNASVTIYTPSGDIFTCDAGVYTKKSGGGGGSPAGGLGACQNEATSSTFGGNNTKCLAIQMAPVNPAPTVTPTCVGMCADGPWTAYVVVHTLIGNGLPSATGTTSLQASDLDGTHYNTISAPNPPFCTSLDFGYTVVPLDTSTASTGVLALGQPCGTPYVDMTGIGDGTNPPQVDQSTGMGISQNLTVQGRVAIGPNFMGNPSLPQYSTLFIADTLTDAAPSPGAIGAAGILAFFDVAPPSAKFDGVFSAIQGAVFATQPANELLGLLFAVQGTGVAVGQAVAVDANVAGTGFTTVRGIVVDDSTVTGAITHYDLELTDTTGSATSALNILSEGVGSINLFQGRNRLGPQHIAAINAYTLVNGDQFYCDDCQVTSVADSTCIGGGSGAASFEVNGVLKCVPFL